LRQAQHLCARPLIGLLVLQFFFLHFLYIALDGGLNTRFMCRQRLAHVFPPRSNRFRAFCIQRFASFRFFCQPFFSYLIADKPRAILAYRLFTFLRYPAEQWKSIRTTNAIERLHEEFKRRIKTQCVLPSIETAAMLFWALLASGQISMRKIDGWQTLATKLIDQPIDLAA